MDNGKQKQEQPKRRSFLDLTDEQMAEMGITAGDLSYADRAERMGDDEGVIYTPPSKQAKPTSPPEGQ